jgi:hypothetical protein
MPAVYHGIRIGDPYIPYPPSDHFPGNLRLYENGSRRLSASAGEAVSHYLPAWMLLVLLLAN